MSDPIRYETNDGIGRLRMDDGKANAMQLAWCEAFEAALDRAESDDTFALIVTGRDGFFSAGLDLKVLPRLPPDLLQRTTDRFMAAMRRIFLFPKPVVAASTGHAIAGGMMLYLAADVRLARRDTISRYGLNEATNGIPLLGGTAGLCQYAIAPQHHTELILHGRMLDAEGTRMRGITHEVVDASDLEACATERAEGLRDLVPPAYRLNKLILRRAAFDGAVAVAESLAGERPDHDVFDAIKR